MRGQTMRQLLHVHAYVGVHLSPHVHVYMYMYVQGQELVTDTENGYFRVHINYYSRVQTVTVLSEQVRDSSVSSSLQATCGFLACLSVTPSYPSIAQPFETTNYLSLYNLHEKYLNNLASRYEEGLILDFFT